MSCYTVVMVGCLLDPLLVQVSEVCTWYHLKLESVLQVDNDPSVSTLCSVVQ